MIKVLTKLNFVIILRISRKNKNLKIIYSKKNLHNYNIIKDYIFSSIFIKIFVLI